MVSASSNALSKPGYFDSYPAASIDFCEPNYTHTPYIAEVFNSVSSLSIVYLGIVGLSTPHTSHPAPLLGFLIQYYHYLLYNLNNF